VHGGGKTEDGRAEKEAENEGKGILYSDRMNRMEKNEQNLKTNSVHSI
jgi:hypothetical protein